MYSHNRMRSYGICFVFIACSVCACAQPATGIKNYYVYTQTVSGGNWRINKTGKPVSKNSDTIFIVYIETAATDTPAYNIACQNGVCYDVTLVAAEKDTLTVGLLKINRQPVTISAGKGNRLWMVKFNGPAQATDTSLQKLNSANQIVLSNTTSNKQINIPLNSAVELYPQKRP
jgi:hypothetical protein